MTHGIDLSPEKALWRGAFVDAPVDCSQFLGHGDSRHLIDPNALICDPGRAEPDMILIRAREVILVTLASFGGRIQVVEEASGS